MITNEILAYTAGLFDGEGHLSIERQKANGTNRKKDYFTLRMVIVNTNLEVITWLIKNFEGNFTIGKKVAGHKQCYKFVLFGEKLIKVLTAIYPYLIIKKPIVDIAFKFRETVGKTGWNVSDKILEQREKLWSQAKKINKPGDHITSPLSP